MKYFVFVIARSHRADYDNRDRYQDDSAECPSCDIHCLIGYLVLFHLFFFVDVYSGAPSTRGLDLVLGQKNESGALYLERGDIFKILLNE